METLYTILDEKISYIAIFFSLASILGFTLVSKYYLKGLFRLFVVLSIFIIGLYEVYLNTLYLTHLKKIYQEKKYNIAQGYIKDYKLGPKKESATFRVNNIDFELSKNYLNAGFNKVKVLHNNIYVKIYYILKNGRKIVLRVDAKI